jgi:asparagine synthase (glutamine-hydrolysing)
VPGISGILSKNTSESLFKKQTEVLNHQNYQIKQKSLTNYKTSVVSLPFSNSNITEIRDRYILTFFGDIYDGAEVSDSDFDLLFVKSFLTQKEKFIEKINGSFQASLYDKRENTLYLISDRAGSKPLYFTKYNDTFSYSCEVKALIQDKSFPRELNIEAIGDLFSLTYVAHRKTLFKNIYCLDPSSILTFKDNTINTARYYKLPYDEDSILQRNFTKKQFSNYSERLYFLLGNSVRRQIDNKKIFIALSGGLDSRFLAAIATKYLPENYITYTFGNPKNDDILFAREVAKILKTNHHEIMISAVEVWRFAEKFSYLADGMSMIDGPIQGIQAINNFKNNLEVLLAPQMADTMWGSTLNKNAVRKLLSVKKVQNHSLHLFNNIFNKIDIRYLNNLFTPDFLKMINPGYTLYDNYTELGLMKHPIYLYQMLLYYEYGRRCTFAGNLMNSYFFDFRIPSYDNELMEYSANLPLVLKNDQLLYIKTFTKYFPELAKIKRENTRLPISTPSMFLRLRYLELKIINRLLKTTLAPKIKTIERYNPHKYINYKQWFRSELNPFLKEILFDPKTMNRPFYKKNSIDILFTKQMNTEYDYSKLIWQIINLEYFLRTYMD